MSIKTFDALQHFKSRFDLFYPMIQNKLLDSSSQMPLKEIPHLLFHGPPSGFYNDFATYFVSKLFSVDYPLKYSEITVPLTHSGSSGNFVYHHVANCIDVNLEPYGQTDKQIMSEILQPILSQTSMDKTTPRHVVLLRNVNKLTMSTQLCLRRMVELLTPTALFIMTASTMTINPALMSRVCRIRCPTIGAEQSKYILQKLSESFDTHTTENGHDLYKALFNTTTKVFQTDLTRLLDLMKRCKTPWNALIYIREMVSKAIVYIDKPALFLKMVLDYFASSPDYDEYVQVAAEADHRITQSHRPMFALESALMKMYAIHKGVLQK